MRTRRRKRKPFTAGQCLDILHRALHRFWLEPDTTSNDLRAVFDAATRLMNVRPDHLRQKADTE